MTKKKRQRKEQRHRERVRAHDERLPTVEHEAPEPDDFDAWHDPRADERLIARINRIPDGPQGLPADVLETVMKEQMLATDISDLLNNVPPPDTPLEQAQEVMYDAFETDDPDGRMRLARKALRISPDCADAYVVLAEESDDREDVKSFYEQGVRAGERALGSGFFTEHGGDFWIHLEARPYMRARLGLGMTHWALRQREEAIAHYQALLDLDSGDYQNVRYTLAVCLQIEGLEDELGELLQRFGDEESAFWLFTRALWRYRGEGASKRATSELKQSIEAYPWVPLYLLGRKHFLIGGWPGMAESEEEREAVTYFMGGIHYWLKAPGAVDWVRENVDERRLSQLERESESSSLPDAAAFEAPGTR